MNRSTPRIARWLLGICLRKELQEEVLGDLNEQFEQYQGPAWRARLNYWRQTILYLRPFALREGIARPTMWVLAHHTFIMSVRTYNRYRASFLIHILGLSSGIVAFLLLFLWVADERSVDQFHVNKQHLYKVMNNSPAASGVITYHGTSGLLAEALMDEVPGVQQVARTSNWTETFTLATEKKVMKAEGMMVSKEFYPLFSFPLILGQSDQVMNDSKSIVLSQSLANELFGSMEKAVGQTIEWEVFGYKRAVIVSGIMADIPANSSLQFDFALSYEHFATELIEYQRWDNNYAVTYVLVDPQAPISKINAQLENFLQTKDENNANNLFLVPATSLYLYNHFENGVQSGGRIFYVQLFTLIAIFILVVASINFMNLSTARSSRRMKEVGVKKTVGAVRFDLIFQYLGEAVLLTTFATVVAYVLLIWLLPEFNTLTGKQLNVPTDLRFLVNLAGFAVLLGIISGSYPAIFLSGFNPTAILKGKLAGVSNSFARKFLLVFQFSITVFLLICVMVVKQQIDFVNTRQLGYNHDNIMYFDQTGSVKAQPETLLSELEKIPGVAAVSATAFSVGIPSTTYGISWGSEQDYEIEFHHVYVGQGFMDMMGFEMVDGRMFSDQIPADTAAIIFNEAAIAAMGLDDPVGKTVRHYLGDHTIVGVVKNFHFDSFFEDVKPMYFLYRPGNTTMIMVRLQGEHIKQTLEQVQQRHAEINPGYPFSYAFVDDDYGRLYESETRVQKLSGLFALLAIIISGLGLFGLAAFTVERRFKEIGIRQVLGSSRIRILSLLSKEFTILVLISTIVGLPMGYLATSVWLERFAFHISPGPIHFIAIVLFVLVIVWLTVGYHTLKAMQSKPIRHLQSE